MSRDAFHHGLLAIYCALGLAQTLAIMAGFETWGLNWLVAAIPALLTAFLPIIGGACAIYGAVVGWGWTIPQASLLFIGPLLAIVALGFAGYALESTQA